MRLFFYAAVNVIYTHMQRLREFAGRLHTYIIPVHRRVNGRAIYLAGLG